MNVHAIVPMKRLTEAKSRLAEAISPHARQALALMMFENVLDTLLCVTYGEGALAWRHGTIGAIWVISADEAICARAAEAGVRVLDDHTTSLNEALGVARDMAHHAGADAVVILPADLPRVTPSDVCGLVEHLWMGAEDTGMAMAIAPDAHHDGTNALALTLPTHVPFLFGPSSFIRYLAAAQTYGIPVAVYRTPTLAMDIDTPDDLMRYQNLCGMETAVRKAQYGYDRICCGA